MTATGEFAIVRDSVVDRAMDREAIAAAAKLWLEWRRHARGSLRNSERHDAQARLWGFRRRDGDALAESLRDASCAASLPGAAVSRPDPDVVCLASQERLASEPTLLADVAAIVLGIPVPSLSIVLRLRLIERTTNMLVSDAKSVLADDAMVLHGLLSDGTFTLKALWFEGLSLDAPELVRLAGWREESTFLEALDADPEARPPIFERLKGRRVPLFSFQRHWIPRAIRRRGIVLPWRRSLPAIVRTLAVHVAVIAACAAIAMRLPVELVLWGMVILILCAVTAGRDALGIARLVKQVALLRRSTRDVLRAVAACRGPYGPIDLDALWPGLGDDPAVRKHSEDLEDAGARHVADVALPGDPTPRYPNRVFALDRERTLVMLGIVASAATRTYFPASMTVTCWTWFADGHVLLTSTASGQGFRKADPRWNATLRVFADCDDVPGALARHLAIAGRLSADHGGAAPLRPENLLEDVERDRAAHAAFQARRGYFTFSDAFRQTFGLVRPEYIEEPLRRTS